MGRKIGKILIVLGMIFLLNVLGSRAEEKVQIYQIYCEEPNGEKGYYTKSVKVEIEHLDQECITKFQLNFPDGKELTGELEKAKEKIVLEENLFEKGNYHLIVWMENKEGKMVEGTEQKREIKIDKEAPADPISFQYSKHNGEEQIISNEEITVEMTASDDTSGIQGIYYQINEEEYQFLEGNCVSVVIPVGFEGNLSAYAIDGAGNKGEVTKSSKIICEDEIPEILIRASEGLGKWYSKPCLIQIDISEHGVASGIKQVICSVNNKVVQNREYERGEKETENVTISVDKLSEIVVEVSDWAGNYTKKREKILFDNENPQLILEGAEDYCIAANDKILTCKAIDNQRIVAVGGTIIWNDANGNRIEKRIESWEKDGAQYFAKENLTESGKYKVYLEAVDQAGNRSEKEMQIIMDKENPLIHKIEELEGKYVPFFEWKYDISEIVEDFTTYTYRINMDGRICEQNKKYTQEGKHSLELIAEDLAGNTSSMEVRFFIDHTPPEIQIDCSKEEKKLDIVLGEEHDFLDAVFINEKKQQIGENERKFSHIFEKSGSYEVLVFARDLAGNQSEKKVAFEIEGEKSFFQNLIQPKKEILKERKTEKRQNSYEALMWILVITGIAVIGIRYKKTSQNREDAG